MAERHTRSKLGSADRFYAVSTERSLPPLLPYVRRNDNDRDAEVAAELAAIRAEATRRAGPFCDDCGYRTRTRNHLKQCGGAR